MDSNRIRVLSSVLSADAWHDPIQIDGKTSAVYVELSFHEGRIGGDDDSFPFTFKLNLKRALLTIRLEPPLSIDRKAVSRSIPDVEVQYTKLRAAKETAERRLAGKAKLNPSAFYAAIQGSAASSAETSDAEALRFVQTLPETLVTARPGDSHTYSWLLEPTFRHALRGQPWHPVTYPRLYFRSPNKLPPLPPTVSINVSCALDDLDISELVPKNEGLNQKIRNLVHRDINEAAAIQHLKMILRDADLESGKLDNRFSEMLLATVLALPE